jgi:hypothetical protein
VSARLTKENKGNEVRATPRAPLVLGLDVGLVTVQPDQRIQPVITSRYYFWFFGYVAKWPFEVEWVQATERSPFAP